MPAADQGVDPSRYMLIPRVLVFLTCGKSVLLLKGSPTKRIWANLYNGIGGHVERGEDVLSAARRELLEETGLVISDMWLCGVISVDTGQNPGIGIFVIRGECPEEAPVASKEGQPEWVQISDINTLPLVEDLYFMLPRVFEAKRTDPPFSANYSYDQNDKLIVRLNE